MSIRSHSVHHSLLLVFPHTVHLFNPHLTNICAVPCAHLRQTRTGIGMHRGRHHLTRPPSNFIIRTFNVRGLSSTTKRGHLKEDFIRQHVDICCIRLIGLPATSRHYGLAFAVSAQLTHRFMRYRSVSDRLAVLQIKLGTKSTLTIINAYGPTTKLANNNQDLQEDFFSQLAALSTRYSSSSLFIIAGYLNRKLGRKTGTRIVPG